MNQRDTAGAVWIVLDRVDLADHAVLVATEVDEPILLLVAATTMPCGDLALVVAAARLPLTKPQVLRNLGAGREFGEVRNAGVATTGAGWIVGANAHDD